jgi:CBS domain-containing protein
MSTESTVARPLELQPPETETRARHRTTGLRRDTRPPARAPAPLGLRRQIEDASDFDELEKVAPALRTTAVLLHNAHVGAAEVGGLISNLTDSLTRRAIELSIRELGPPPCPFSWVALGSHGRREPVLGSDVDSALALDCDAEDEDPKKYMLSLGSGVCEGLARCGLVADRRGASAGGDLFVRPMRDWRRLIRESISQPEKDKGLIVISLFLDGRVLHHGGGASAIRDELAAAAGSRGLLRLMLRLAVANRPAAARLRDFFLERSGEHRGRLDIKHGGLLPVTSIARYASLAAGAIAAGSTPERLSAADVAGTLDADAARSLHEAFELFQSQRLEHQVHQIERGVEPDDYLDPEELSNDTRRRLRDAFREVRAVQRKLGGQLSAELAFA